MSSSVMLRSSLTGACHLKPNSPPPRMFAMATIPPMSRIIWNVWFQAGRVAAPIAP